MVCCSHGTSFQNSSKRCHRTHLHSDGGVFGCTDRRTWPGSLRTRAGWSPVHLESESRERLECSLSLRGTGQAAGRACFSCHTASGRSVVPSPAHLFWPGPSLLARPISSGPAHLFWPGPSLLARAGVWPPIGVLGVGAGGSIGQLQPQATELVMGW
jgi:hypothetical protein